MRLKKQLRSPKARARNEAIKEDAGSRVFKIHIFLGLLCERTGSRIPLKKLFSTERISSENRVPVQAMQNRCR